MPAPSGESLLPKILVVEDELAVRTIIRRALLSAGYRVLEAADGATALRLIEEGDPALVVLDVNMPGMDGYDALKLMRRRKFAPLVLMMSTESAVERRLKGLGLGADDFLPKPFDLRELLARVTALLRRVPPSPAERSTLVFGAVKVDLAAKQAERDGKALALTAKEFALLEELARHAGRPVSKKQLLQAVWGYSSETKTRTVETHLWRLRKKLGDESGPRGWIQNRPNLGYLLATEQMAATADDREDCDTDSPGRAIGR